MKASTIIASSRVRMAVLSALSFVLNVGLFTVMQRYPGMRAELASASAMMAMLFVNFAACRWFVFRAAKGSLRKQALLFAGGTLIFRGLEWLSFNTLASLSGGNTLVLYPATLAAFFVAKLLMYGRFVFGSRD